MNEQLLQMMQTDPAGARRMLEAAVTERSASDPMLAMMMQMMNSRRSEEPPENRRRERVERVRSHLGELRSALASAHGLLDDIADALGACDVCWGSDERCRECRGRGTPGWRMPDEELFAELVAPAVKRHAEGQHTKGETE
jgi:hypothetical protein